MAKRPVPLYDFKAFGAAIKAARNEYGESRKKVSDELYISPRYLANIENKGQQPSLQVFYDLVTRYHISVDQFFFPNSNAEKSTGRRHKRYWMQERTTREKIEHGIRDAMNRWFMAFFFYLRLPNAFSCSWFPDGPPRTHEVCSCRSLCQLPVFNGFFFFPHGLIKRHGLQQFFMFPTAL